MKKKKALLINPWIVDFAAYDFWLRPLPLFMIGAVLRDSGFDVSLVDCLDRTNASQSAGYTRDRSDGTGSFLKTKIEKPEILKFVPRHYSRYGISETAFIDELERCGKPDVALVTSSMTYWYPGAFKVIETVKGKWTDVPVVLGGRYATLCRDHAEKNSGADFVFNGMPDERLSRLIYGLTGVDCPMPDSIAGFPLPAHDLHNDARVASITLSMGCPFRCTYCVSHKLFPDFVQRSVEDAIREIDFLAARGVRHISFCDDALLVGAEDLFIPFLRHVIDKKYGIRFYTPNAMHARYMTPGIARLLREAGFSHIRIGFESADGDFQCDTGGKSTAGHFRHAVSCLKGAGFSGADVGAYIIFGHPAQSESSLRDAIEMADSLGVEPIPAEFSPIPGSAVFDLARNAFLRDPASDPLLQNSSIVMYQHPNISPGTFQELRMKCRDIRKKLRRN